MNYCNTCKFWKFDEIWGESRRCGAGLSNFVEVDSYDADGESLYTMHNFGCVLHKPWVWEGMRFKFLPGGRYDQLYRVDKIERFHDSLLPVAQVQVSAIRKDGRLHAVRLGFSGNLIHGSFLEQPL